MSCDYSEFDLNLTEVTPKHVIIPLPECDFMGERLKHFKPQISQSVIEDTTANRWLMEECERNVDLCQL